MNTDGVTLQPGFGISRGQSESSQVSVYDCVRAARSVDSSLTDSRSKGVNMTDACDVWKSHAALSSHILRLITRVANKPDHRGRCGKNNDEATITTIMFSTF